MKKLLSHLRWFFAYIPLGVIAFITAPFIYPIAEITKLKFLKWWLDDEILSDESNADWRAYKTNLPHWLRLYLWHGFRNTMWNLKVAIKPEKARLNCVYNNEVIVDLKQNTLTNKGKKLNLNDACLHMAGLKWITKDGQEGWHVFSGEKISQKYSIFGTAEYWYEANGKLYYRYSTVRTWGMFIIYFAMGATEKRYLLNFKIYNKNKVT